MNDAAATTCPACGVGYRARPDAAGGVFACACGHRLRVPDGGAGEAQPVDPHATVVDHVACPACRTVWPKPARLCVTCGYDFEIGRITRTERDEPKLTYAEQVNQGGWDRVRARELPLAMIGAGAAALVVGVARAEAPGTWAAAAIGSTVVSWLALMIGSMLLGVFASGEFGPFAWRCVMMLAIALPVAVAGRFAADVDWFTGGLGVFMVKPLVYYALLAMLFGLDGLLGLFAGMVVFILDGVLLLLIA